MNYYEEFGLTSEASEAEIRSSYRRIAQVLHPDQYQDPKIRSLAEVQMKRINEIASILLSQEKRRIYDASLTSLPAEMPSDSSSVQMWVRENPAWALLGVMTLALLVLTAIFPPQGVPEQSTSPTFADSSPRPAKARVIEKATANVRVPFKARTVDNKRVVPRAIAEITPEVPHSEPVASSGSGIVAPEIAPVRPPEVSSSIGSPRQLRGPDSPETVAPATLLGHWVFTPNPNDPSESGHYPAEYVELSVAPAGEMVRGFYRGRYKVPNETLNPLVEFHFEGTSGQTTFAWRGESGAKGTITLLLEHADTLKIKWVASAMGKTLSLGSGDAVLYRFR